MGIGAGLQGFELIPKVVTGALFVDGKKNQQTAYVRSYPQDDEVVELLIQGLTEREEYFLSPGGHWLRGDWRNHSFLRPAQNVMISVKVTLPSRLLLWRKSKTTPTTIVTTPSTFSSDVVSTHACGDPTNLRVTMNQNAMK